MLLTELFYFLVSINGDGAAQPVPSTSKPHQEGPVSGESDEAGRASWPAPFEMPSSLSEEPGGSNQVSVYDVLNGTLVLAGRDTC